LLHRFEQEPEFKSTSAHDYQDRRLDQISKVIDEHLAVLHGEARVKAFEHLVPQQKLKYLLQKQNLIKVDQKGKERLRMHGLTQSYNIFDSVAFKKNKAVQQKLQESNNAYKL